MKLRLVLALMVFGASPTLAEEILLKSGQVIKDVQILTYSDNARKSVVRYMNRYGEVSEVALGKVASVRVDIVRTWDKPDPYRRTDRRIQRAYSAEAQGPVRIPWRLQPFWRSVIFPGWGQYSDDEHTKGQLIFGGTLFLFYRYWTNRKNALRSEEEHNDPIVSAGLIIGAPGGPGILASLAHLEGLKAEGRAYIRAGNRAVQLLMILYVWQLYDIHKADPIRLFVRNSTDFVALGLEMKF